MPLYIVSIFGRIGLARDISCPSKITGLRSGRSWNGSQSWDSLCLRGRDMPAKVSDLKASITFPYDGPAFTSGCVNNSGADDLCGDATNLLGSSPRVDLRPSRRDDSSRCDGFDRGVRDADSSRSSVATRDCKASIFSRSCHCACNRSVKYSWHLTTI